MLTLRLTPVVKKKTLPPTDVQSAVSTRRVRGGDYLNLFLATWQQRRETVPKMNKKVYTASISEE